MDETRAEKFAGLAKGILVPTTEHLEEWLSGVADTAKTMDEKRAAIRRFSNEFPTLNDVTRKGAQRWINKLSQKDGLAPPTVRKMLSGVRGYWKYMKAIEAVPDDSFPFDHLEIPKRNEKAVIDGERHPFESREVVAFLKAAESRGDRQLADVITLAMWTGCRIEELCSLPVERAKDGVIEIKDAKTRSGWRRIPVHSKLRPDLDRMAEESHDGYVMNGLTANKYDDRSGAVGKRFGRLKKKMGHGSQQTFHSIRGTVSTLLENAGIPENVSADIMGHKKPTMTYGLYSGGSTVSVMRDAIEQIDYPL